MVDSVKLLSAANAYNNSIQDFKKNSTSMIPLSGGGGKVESTFSTMIGHSIESAATKVKSGETAAIKGLVDEASLADVATAVSDAELTLKTVVAVRDRMISAYQDIIKMPI